MMKITFAAPRPPRAGTVAVPVAEERKLLATAAKLDKESGGTLTRAMAASRFKGRGDETLAVLAPANLELARVLLLRHRQGGRRATRSAWQNRGGQLVAQLNGAGETTARS